MTGVFPSSFVLTIDLVKKYYWRRKSGVPRVGAKLIYLCTLDLDWMHLRYTFPKLIHWRLTGVDDFL